MTKFLIRIIPWLLSLGLLYLLYIDRNTETETTKEEITSTILTEVEALGKMELVRYNFQEVTEVKKMSVEFLNLFKIDRDSKIVLISQGNAVACVDLTQVVEEDIESSEEGLMIYLPLPELCHFKLDLQKSRIYALETGFTIDRERFIQEAYKKAEKQIEQAALSSGILEQAEVMGKAVLEPLFEKIAGKKVEIVFRELPKAPAISEDS